MTENFPDETLEAKQRNLGRYKCHNCSRTFVQILQVAQARYDFEWMRMIHWWVPQNLFEVASYIIDIQPGRLVPAKERLVTAVFGEKYKQPDSQPDLTKCDGTLKTITDSINRHREKTINLTIEEAAGYTMLGIYAVNFSEILSEELSKVMMYWNQMMTANNKKRGQNPTSDTAIIMLLESSAKSLDPKKIPVVVYEYKPVVHQDHGRVNDCDLVEALLQASYCLRFYHKLCQGM